jgi:hypothetical protein
VSKGSKLKLPGKNTARGSVACAASSNADDDDDDDGVGGEKSKRLSEALRRSADEGQGRGSLELFLLLLAFLLPLAPLLLVLPPSL